MLKEIYENLIKGTEVQICLTGRREVITGTIEEVHPTYLVVREERYEGLTRRKYVAGKYIEELVTYEG